MYFDYILETDYPVYILVGGRNSGKTFFMGQLATMNLNKLKDYKMLIVEDVETNINEGVKTNVLERIEDFGWGSMFHSTKQPAKITHKITKNSILFKGYHSSKQQKRIKSLNKITAAWYEEAENITYEQFKALQIQLRGGDPRDRKLFLTMNPVNQDGFINKEFFKKKPDKIIEKFPDGRSKVFIQNIETEIEDGEKIVTPCMIIVSTYKDNPHLTKQQIADIEDYKKESKNLDDMDDELLTLNLKTFSNNKIYYKGKDLENMSPGSQTNILMEYIVKADSTVPLLIDQPEDNVDNNAIYNDLTTWISELKYKRQIIVVTHDANIVINADAENLILADQIVNNKFKYVFGALEYNDNLSRASIILDGGAEAVKRRLLKYGE